MISNIEKYDGRTRRRRDLDTRDWTLLSIKPIKTDARVTPFYCVYYIGRMYAITSWEELSEDVLRGFIIDFIYRFVYFFFLHSVYHTYNNKYERK